jgi:hypothetical protein
MKKLIYNEVKKVFEDGGCELLSSEYKNNFTKMRYRCSCGNVSDISLTHFKKGRRCRECGYKKSSLTHTYTHKEVKKIFVKNNCELLSGEYGGHNSKLEYKCVCGNISKITLTNFNRGHRCKKCWYEKIAKNLSFSYNQVKKIFKDGGGELLSKKYKNANSYLKYRCSCGNISKITLAHFSQGQRCKKCGIEKISGKNNYNWNFDLTVEERDIKRDYAEYKNWRKKVYARDGYVCQRCFKKGNYLNAHHILNYSTYKDLRLVTANGITLCRGCHIWFHKKYGKKDNNAKQLDEFLKKLIVL